MCGFEYHSDYQERHQMGYLSDFVINFESGDHKLVEQIAARLSKISGYDWNTNFVHHDIKWYDSRQDMLVLSVEYPDILFSVDRNGEDRDDISKLYFQNGKWQECAAILVFEDYDPLKMS